jgi:hypothetical protein
MARDREEFPLRPLRNPLRPFAFNLQFLPFIKTKTKRCSCRLATCDIRL